MITSFIIHYFGWQPRSRFGGHCPRWGRFAQADCRHEMRPMTFLDPGAFSGSIFRREFVLLYSASARIVMKPLLFALCVVFGFEGLSEQKPAWQPAPGHTEIAIWPGAAPDPQRVAGPEY